MESDPFLLNERLSEQLGQYELDIDRLRRENDRLKSKIDSKEQKFVQLNAEKHDLEDKISSLKVLIGRAFKLLEIVFLIKEQFGNDWQNGREEAKKLVQTPF